MWSEDQDLFFYPFRFLIAAALFMDPLNYNIDSFVKNQLWTLFSRHYSVYLYVFLKGDISFFKLVYIHNKFWIVKITLGRKFWQKSKLGRLKTFLWNFNSLKHQFVSFHKIQHFEDHILFLLSIFFHVFFISWRLITLQYCSVFCHTLTWISLEIILELL